MVEGRVDMINSEGTQGAGVLGPASQAENSYGHSYGRIWEWKACVYRSSDTDARATGRAVAVVVRPAEVKVAPLLTHLEIQRPASSVP